MRLPNIAWMHDEEGSSLIELSFILPVILLMLLGVLDYGLVLEQYMTFNDSVRAAAEFATIYGEDANTSSMQSLATQFAVNVPNYQVSAAVVCTCSPGGSSVSCTSSCSGIPSVPYQYAQVTATASLPLIFQVQGFPASIPVKSTTMVPISYRGGA